MEDLRKFKTSELIEELARRGYFSAPKDGTWPDDVSDDLGMSNCRH